jgi:transposase
LVERFFNKIKHYQRVAARYGKLVSNYRIFVQLASIRPWLRVAERRGVVSFRAVRH